MRPREIDPTQGAERVSFRISGEDMAELEAAIDAESLTASQLVRMIVHGWAEERRERRGAARERRAARTRAVGHARGSA